MGSAAVDFVEEMFVKTQLGVVFEILGHCGFVEFEQFGFEPTQSFGKRHGQSARLAIACGVISDAGVFVAAHRGVHAYS